jgi:hypothetical protein
MTNKKLGRPTAFARSSDPSTSHDAAAELTPKLRKIQADVLAFAARRRGFTDPQLGEHFNDYGSTHRSRRAELVDLGLIEDSGIRLGEKGHKHTVWRISEAGRRVLQGCELPEPPMAA